MTNSFNNQDEQTIMQRLEAPFHLSDIEFRIGSMSPDKSRGMALAYVTSRAIQNRLDDVFGIGGWTNKFEVWKGKGVLCTISVRINGEWISKTDGADDTDFEPTKGGLSDSFKRAAVLLGCGRYLYRLEPQWVAIKPSGKSHIFVEKPTLPDWALPSEESQQHYSAAALVQLQASRPDALNNITHYQDKNVQTEIPHEEKCICAICGQKNVTTKAKKFSTDRWGKAICFNCQKTGQFEAANQKVSGNPVPVSAQQHAEPGDYGQSFDDEVPF